MRYKDLTLEEKKQYHIDRMKEWKEQNQERYNQYHVEWFMKNRDKVKRYKEENIEKERAYTRKYCSKPEVKKRRQEYRNRKRVTEPKYRLSRNTSSAIYRSLRGNKAGKHWEILVGYTTRDLMNHLEAQFDENMFWHNYGIYWHIDHIRPISSFNYETPDNTEFKKCWALSNLQPLEARANMIKANKYKEL